MIVAVGVADGIQWQFIVANPAWVLNHNYTAQAVITPTYFELYLNGQLLGHVSQRILWPADTRTCWRTPYPPGRREPATIW